MVHSIELVFDAETEVSIRRLWADLAAAGIPSQAPASRPHVTLVVAQRISADVDEVLAPLCERLPLDCVLGAPILFGRSPFILARLAVPSAALLALQAEVHRHAGRYLEPAVMPNCAPDRWTPHVTLARRVGPALSRALRIAGRADITGRFVGLRRWDGNHRAEYPIS